MGKKIYTISSKNRPNKIIELMLRGADVPNGFRCDGCSQSPDFYFRWCCFIHDYMAFISRKNWAVLMDNADAEDAKTKKIMFLVLNEDTGKYEPKKVTLKRGFELWDEHFDLMAELLKKNIRTLSKWTIVDGELKKRPFWHWRRIFGYQLSHLYAKVTHGVDKWARRRDEELND